MMMNAAEIDPLFRALADPTRRRVLERLSFGPASASELAAPFGLALPSFLQHMKMLEESGLVHSDKKGRVRHFSLNGAQLKRAETWLSDQRKIWERRLAGMDDYLLNLKDDTP